MLTFDLDVIPVLPRTSSGLMTLEPIYQAMRTRGYEVDAECVNVEGVPVQFLPAYNPLVEEALTEARQVSYGDTTTRVLRPEHLLAMALQTGRDKDRERVRLLLEQGTLDRDFLAGIIARHALEEKWNEWTR